MDPITSLTDTSAKRIRIAINGFGRIGRQFFKVAFDNPNIEIVAINDLGVFRKDHTINNTALKELINTYKKD